jgi:hypothetical protein
VPLPDVNEGKTFDEDLDDEDEFDHGKKWG